MKHLEIDLDAGVVTVDRGAAVHSLNSPDGFAAVSRAWLRAGWDTKYVYSFTWLGRPIIQLPDDLLRLQELVFRVRPEVIVETGIAHGGSLVFQASLCKLMGAGRVIGVDVEIRPHNRRAIEAHPLASYITLIEGDSIDPAVVEQVRAAVGSASTVLVLLDSGHTKEHVLAELQAYSTLVSQGSYIVAMDGIMEQLAGAPRTEPDWEWNNPRRAALKFVQANPDFVVEEPGFPFNEGVVTDRVTYWPDAFIKRVATSG